MNATNPQISYLSSLQLAGLSPEQATIYEVLLKNGALPAGKIHQKTPYKRGLVYKLLEQMVEMGVVIKREDIAKIAIFEPAHPLKLKELAEKREEQAKTAQSALSGILNQMTSEFNLVSGKPGVQFFEGLEGIKEVISDTLTTDTEILQYLDLDSLEQKFPKESEVFTDRRLKLKIKKRILIRDSAFARSQNLQSDAHTEYRFLPIEQELHSLSYIYSNKIAYVTLDSKHLIGIIIQNEIITNTNIALFNALWAQCNSTEKTTHSPQELSPSHLPNVPLSNM